MALLLGGTAVLLLHSASFAQPPAVMPPFAGPGIALAPIFTDHAVTTPLKTQAQRNTCTKVPKYNYARPSVTSSSIAMCWSE
jgi:hypothetical protein